VAFNWVYVVWTLTDVVGWRG